MTTSGGLGAFAAAALACLALSARAAPPGAPALRQDSGPAPSKAEGPALTAAEPPAPAKPLEEPVFQLPELVIVGENQARILAQKEAFASSPLKGLREAPLLEKEELSVAGLRRRAAAPGGTPDRTGRAGVARLEGGGPFDGAQGRLAPWFGGGVWLADLRPAGTRALSLEASGRAGDGTAGGVLGGSDMALAAEASRRGGLGRLADAGSLEAGWRATSRALNSGYAADRRRLDRLAVAGEVSRDRDGASALARIAGARRATPRGSLTAGWLAASAEAPVWTRGPVTATARPRLEAEAAGIAGSHALAGADAEAAWVPGGAWRLRLGAAADGAFGGGMSAGSVRPLAGVAWRTPAGPVAEVSFAPGFHVPWVSRKAEDHPYAWFSTAPVPERDRADLVVGGRLEHEDGSEFRAAYRYRNTANAASWLERTGEGLWEPVAVASAAVNEVNAAVTLRQFRPFVLTARGAWRNVDAGGLLLANVPNAEGVLGAAWSRGRLSAGTGLAVLMARPRSVLGGELPAYADWSLSGAWRATDALELWGRGENLLGADVQPWGGYPEPKALISAGARLVF